jgi:phosphatidylglycerophosphate synthase
MGELRAAHRALSAGSMVAGPLSTPAPAKAPSRLEIWSRVHAPIMIVACACAAVLGTPWAVGAAGTLSFAVLLVQSRSAWATQARTIWPNAVTLLRLAIVVTMGSFAHSAPGLAWAAAVGAIFALDYVDGWVARRTGGTTAFGAHFDMETDALVVLVVDLELWLRGQLGPWILTTGLLRYAYVVCVALVPPRGGEMPRSTLGRNAFGTLVTGLTVALAAPGPVGTAGAVIGTAAVTFSFARAFQWSYFQKPSAAA